MMPVKRVATGLYLTIFWVGLVAGGAMTGLAVSDSKVEELLMVSWAPLLLSIIATWVLLHKAWGAIQDGHARTTPGKALGFLFIPLFNIYWLFIAIGSWGTEFNSFADRQRVSGHRASPGLFMAHCILSLIPFGAAITIFTGTAILVQFCRGINAVAEHQSPSLPTAVARQR
jgi:hypothetical protein